MTHQRLRNVAVLSHEKCLNTIREMPSDKLFGHFFTARRICTARIMTLQNVVCPYVCLSVRPSHAAHEVW